MSDEKRIGECESCESKDVLVRVFKHHLAHDSQYVCKLCLHLGVVSAQHHARPDASVLTGIAYVGNEILKAIKAGQSITWEDGR